MAQYIDKSALVAEIERLISNGQVKLQESQESNDDESYVAWAEHIATCIKVLSFLDTLEVKEVDLEKHLKEDIEDVFFDLDGVAVKGATHYLTVEELKDLAKYFFELGMQQSKNHNNNEK